MNRISTLIILFLAIQLHCARHSNVGPLKSFGGISLDIDSNSPVAQGSQHVSPAQHHLQNLLRARTARSQGTPAALGSIGDEERYTAPVPPPPGDEDPGQNEVATDPRGPPSATGTISFPQTSTGTSGTHSDEELGQHATPTAPPGKSPEATGCIATFEKSSALKTSLPGGNQQGHSDHDQIARAEGCIGHDERQTTPCRQIRSKEDIGQNIHAKPLPSPDRKRQAKGHGLAAGNPLKSNSQVNTSTQRTTSGDLDLSNLQANNSGNSRRKGDMRTVAYGAPVSAKRAKRSYGTIQISNGPREE